MPRAKGYVSTSATTTVAVNATTYTEQTSGAQRAIKSSSANDAAAGTGVQTVKLTYFKLDANNNIIGPYSEVITLNGTSAVATAGTAIALVESIEAVTVGSGGVAAGTISLTVVSDGSGGTIASIAAGDNRTWYAHHYIPGIAGTASNPRYALQDITVVSNSTGTNPQAQVQIRSLPYGVTNAVEQIIVENAAAGGVAPSVSQVSLVGIRPVQGPARVQAYVAPRENSSQITRVEFELTPA